MDSGRIVDIELPANFLEIRNNCFLANGDCIERMRLIPSHSIDLIITDPPYNLGLFMHHRGTNLKKMRENAFAYAGWDNLDFDKWCLMMKQFLSECSRVLKKRGSLIVFMSIIKAGKLVELAEDTKLYYKTTGVWHKTNPMPRNMNLHFINSTEAWLYFVNESLTGTFNNSKLAIHDFIETPTIAKKEKRIVNHPTQKPIALIDHFVRILSNPNDVVLDPFMGSGSTGVSSINLNRKFIGIELSSSYFKLTQKRIKEDCK